MKLSALTLTIAALALTIPASASALPIDPADQAQLDAARAKWEATGILNYSYKISRICFCPTEYTRPRNIVVQNGKPVKRRSTKNYRDVDTVEELFDEAQAALDDDNFSITYAPRKGFPRAIDSDPSFMIADEETSYRVRHFAVPID